MAISTILYIFTGLATFPIFVWLCTQYLNWSWRLIDRWNRSLDTRRILKLQGELTRLRWERDQTTDTFERDLYDEKIEEAEERLSEVYRAQW